jgi:DNA invertase Pin-like site-specific DNA recombinase
LIGCEARARSLLSQASRARVHKPGDVGDARDIADELTAMGVVLSLGGSTYDPTDPVGRLLFNVLGMVAEFEAGLMRMRTREGVGLSPKRRGD